MQTTKRFRDALGVIEQQMVLNANRATALAVAGEACAAAVDYARSCAYALALQTLYSALGDQDQETRFCRARSMYANKELRARLRSEG